MFLFDSGSCMHNEAMPSHTTHTDTPTQSNLIHSCTYRHTKNPTQSPTHTTYQIRKLFYIPNSAWLLDVWFSIWHECGVCVFRWLLLLFIPVFNVVWLCSQAAELISFLMVGYQCLSQMNYAFLPYVISSQPGNTGTILVTWKQIIFCWLLLRFN